MPRVAMMSCSDRSPAAASAHRNPHHSARARCSGLSRSWENYRAWKLSWNVPRRTHTYFVEDLLATGARTLHEQILMKCGMVFRQSLVSESEKVWLLATLMAHNVMSNAGDNLVRLKPETRVDPWTGLLHSCIEKLSNDRVAVPPPDEWRVNSVRLNIRCRGKSKAEGKS